MFLAGLFGWNDAEGSVMKLAPRSSAELVTETLMLELGSHIKRSERQQRERLIEYRRVKSGVDYTWLASFPRQGFELSPGDELELRDICSKISPSQCGPVILRFRRLMLEFEPEGAEIPRLFRSVLHDFVVQEEEQQKKKLEGPWEKRRRAKSLATFSFKPPRLRVNPFQLEDTHGSDTESELAASGRARSKSMPEFSTTGEVH
ncbi:protein RD3-like [Spea bombifrons]|uniref:protein RD3-like n=1 Tax=Spea bombifrons TaxID=233779 RepID=UPI00234BD2F5|nr:protein RD3-like [Spea bombifrons]